jgi:hypothetical protein
MEKCIIIATVRGLVDERHDLNRRAKDAGLSLNNYVRQQLGLPLIEDKLGRPKKEDRENEALDNAIGRLRCGFRPSAEGFHAGTDHI